MEIPAGEVTVLLGSAPDRRRLLAALSDTAVATPGTRRPVLRRVVASPALPVVKRVVFLLNAADAADVDLVLVDRATDGLDAVDRRFFLDHLRLVTARGTAVAVDDDDPVAALAVADRSLRAEGGCRPVLTDLDRMPLTA